MMLNDLPVDILVEILTLVASNNRRDFISICTASRACYEAGKHILFCQTRCGWNGLDKLIKTFSNGNISEQWSKHITFFHLHDANCWHEWRSTQLLEVFLRICPRLCRLRLHLSGTSKWLKYVSGAEHITDLCLVSDRFQQGSTSLPVPAQSAKGRSNVRLSMFDIQDLAGFPNLQILELHHCFLTASLEPAGGQAEIGEQPTTNLLNSLQSLVIFNCHWHFPLSLDIFSGISTLVVLYIENHGQIISERQLELAKSSPESLRAIAFAYKVDPRYVDHWIEMLCLRLMCRQKLFAGSVKDNRRPLSEDCTTARVFQEPLFEGQTFTSYSLSSQTSSEAGIKDTQRHACDKQINQHSRNSYPSLALKLNSVSDRR